MEVGAPKASIIRDRRSDGYRWRLTAGGVTVESFTHPTEIRAHEEMNRFLNGLWLEGLET